MSNRARMVDGHLVRDWSYQSQFSMKRFLLLTALCSLMIITNPSNELHGKANEILDLLLPSSKNQRQREPPSWAWDKMLDPPISTTNYGLFTVEERHAKLTFLGLTQEYSCSYFDERTGSFCSALARNLCHGKPLLHDPKNYAYTAHRTICYLLIAFSLLSFCHGGAAPPANGPLLQALLNSMGRPHFSLVYLGLDLFNASTHVYPALVRMEQIVPTLQEGGIAAPLGLPAFVDFVFCVLVLVVFLGGGSNALASHFTRHPCLGFDSTVAAAAGYCSGFQANPGANPMFAPTTVLWAYLPLVAVLGGSSLSWILGGMLGTMLAQYHLDNQDVFLAIKQTVFSIFKN